MNRYEKLVEAFKSIELFNQLAEKEQSYYLEALDVQAPVVLEEVLELIDALEDVNDIEIVDAIGDSIVTTLGLIKRGEDAGFNVLDALLTICQNNLEKYTSDYAQAVRWAMIKENEIGEEVAVFGNEELGLYGIKNVATGKILKPFSHAKVVLTDFIPNHEEK